MEGQEPILGPFQRMWTQILDYVPSLVAGMLVLLLGLAVCWVVKRVVFRAMLLLRLDRRLRNARWARGLSHADTRYALADLVGNAAATMTFLVFLENAFVVWGLDVLARLIGALVFYLPKLVVGMVVLLVGSLIAAMVAGRVRAGLAMEGVARAPLAGRLTLWALMGITAAFALEEMGIAPHTLQTALKIGLGTLGLVVALAVGLGSREAVARMWKAVLDRPGKGAPSS